MIRVPIRLTNFRVYLGAHYSLAVRRLKPILGIGWRIDPHFRSGLRLRNYRAVAENRYFFASSVR